MNRRDLLLLRPDGPRATVLSCERLYMRYVDAEAAGTTTALFDTLAADLRDARHIRLVETSWLSCDDLRARLDAVLACFRARGGRVLKGSPC
jgi:hypothetical protein